MIIDLPKLGPVSFDDNLSADQLNAELDRLGTKYGFETPKSQLGFGEMAQRGVIRGAKQVGSAFGDVIPAMAAKAMGFDEYAKQQMQEAAETQKEIQQKYAPQYPSIESVKGISDVPGFVLETVAEQVPNLATALIPGGIGGTIARRAGIAAAGRAAMPLIESGATEAELARVAARKGAEYAATGQGLGIYLGSYAQNAPEIFGNIYEKTQDLAPGAAMLFGAAAAALDSVLPARLMSKLTGPMKVGVVEKILEKSGMDRGLVRSVTAGLLEGTGWEGLTEGAQEAISMAAENFVANTPQVFESADWKRIMEASVRGAVAGGVFGGVGGGFEAGRAGAERKQQYQEALAERQGRLAQRAEREQKIVQEDEAKRAVAVAQAQARLKQLIDDEMEGTLPKEAPPKVTPPVPAATTQITETPEEAEQRELMEGRITPAAPVPEVQLTKAQINQQRQEEQRLRALLRAKQLPLPLEVPTGITPQAEAAPTQTTRKAATPPQLDLFNQPPRGTPSVAQTTEAIQAETQKPAEGIQPATTAAAAAEATTEPVVRKQIGRPAVETLSVPDTLGPVVNDNVLAALGITTGTGIRKNKVLEGVSVSDPRVREALDAVASATKSTDTRNRIESFLSRPDIAKAEVAENVPVKSEPTAEAVQRPVESGIPSAGEGEGVAVRGGTGRAGEPAARGLGEAGAPAASAVGGKEAAPATVTEQKASFVAAQNTAAKAVEARRASIERMRTAVDKHLGNLDTQQLEAAGIDTTKEPASLQSHRGTSAHNLLQVPALVREYFKLKDLAIKNGEEPKDWRKPLWQLKNAQLAEESRIIVNALSEIDPRANELIRRLEQAEPATRAEFLANTQRQAEAEFAKQNERRVHLATLSNKFFKATGRTLFGPAYQGTNLNAATLEHVKNNNLDGVLGNMLNTIKDPAIQRVIRKIRGLGLDTKIVIGEVEGGRPASFNPDTNTITLDPNFGLTEHAVIHEVMHGAIAHVLNSPNHPLTKSFAEFFSQIKDRLGDAYGAQNLHEFSSELVSNPQFQALLKDIKPPKGESLWKAIIRRIAEFFGFQPNQKDAFTQGLKFVEDALDVSHGVEASPAQKLFLGNGGLKDVGGIGTAMPKMVGRTVEDAKNTFSNLKDYGFAKAAFGLLRLDHINKLYGKELPSLQKLIDALEKRAGTQELKIKQVNDTYDFLLKTSRKYEKDMAKLGDIAIDARLAEVDILDPKFTPTAANQAEYNRLKAAFQSRPADVKKSYELMRRDYDAALNEYQNLLTSSVSPSLAKRLANQFAAQKRVVGYVPFTRHGDFWVEYADPATGERTASAFESVRERNQFIQTQLKPNNIAFKEYQNIQDIRYTGQDIPPTSFLHEVIADLQKQKASQEMIDSVYQSYLTLFPAQSIMKQFLKSENVRGMERDLVRSYGDVMVKWARKLSNSEYTPQIDRALLEIRAQAENANNPTIYAAAQNIVDQAGFFHNPTFNKLTHTATALSYFEYIAGNVSSALVNIASLPMLVWPTLGGKFGFSKTNAAMAAAGKLAMGNWGGNARYASLYKTLMEHAQLQHTMAREVLEGRRQKTSEYLGLKAKIMDGLSIPFAVSERYNRATTAIAAFDLARANNMSEQEAINYALNTVKDLHTSGLSATAPSIMQNPIGRVFFTFKSYVWNSAFIIARAFHQAFKGETPEIQRAARKQLLGMYGMSMAFAGAKGLPFYGAASTLATMISALFGDDDKPFDFDEEMRDFFGELGYKGLFNYLTNLEVANRTGLATDLVFRDDPRGVADHGYVLSAMQQAFGPAGTYAVNVGNAAKMFNEGHTERAVEAVLPSFVRNGMKGMRYFAEGAKTLKGDPVVEDVSAYNSLMQAFGFAPADLSSTYEKVSAAKGFEREVNARRARILNLFEMGRMSGDQEILDKANEERAKFNDAFPQKRIDNSTLQKSINSRREAEKRMIHGVTFDRKLRPEIEERFFQE